MRFPKFWRRVESESGAVIARGWSDENPEEAQRLAELRFSRIMAALRRGAVDDLTNDYQYVIDHVICEFVVDRINNEQGDEIAVISRNAYGSLVLNTTKMIIMDIDLPPQKVKGGGLLSWLFGKRVLEFADEVGPRIEALSQWQQQHSDFALRVYRTAAGLRAIVPNRVVDGIDSEIMQMMQELQTDPLYQELCRKQGCFRARLTPKPWRVSLERPPAKFPFKTPDLERQFDDWFERYLKAGQGHQVCEWITNLGGDETHPEIATLIELHDNFCCRGERHKLA